MQILVVHNRYRSAIPSGENAVVDNEISALRAAGHDVATYLRESDEIATMSAASRLAHVASPLHSASTVRAARARETPSAAITSAMNWSRRPSMSSAMRYRICERL